MSPMLLSGLTSFSQQVLQTTWSGKSACACTYQRHKGLREFLLGEGRWLSLSGGVYDVGARSWGFRFRVSDVDLSSSPPKIRLLNRFANTASLLIPLKASPPQLLQVPCQALDGSQPGVDAGGRRRFWGRTLSLLFQGFRVEVLLLSVSVFLLLRFFVSVFSVSVDL